MKLKSNKDVKIKEMSNSEKITFLSKMEVNEARYFMKQFRSGLVDWNGKKSLPNEIPSKIDSAKLEIKRIFNNKTRRTAKMASLAGL